MKKELVLSGTQQEVDNQLRKLSYEFKFINQVDYNVYSDTLCVMVVECTEYTMEEKQEMQMYGDPDHEAYLMSDDYEYDCRSEQYDWIKNA